MFEIFVFAENQAASISTNLIRVHHPYRVDGWIMLAESLCELYSAEKAVETLLLDEERFKESARYIFAIGRYYALANEIQRAREYIRRAIGLDVSINDDLISDPDLDVIWRDPQGNE